MKLVLSLLLFAAMPLAAQDSLAARIGHTDPAKRGSGRSHGSLGDMKCQTLMPRGSIPFLIFMHRCEMTAPNGGVGEHFHNTGEEMFIVFDGEAEFTIDGHTSVLKGHVVGAPVRMGHSHAIINTTGKPEQFMNIQVALNDGVSSDAFNLADPRLGAPKDAMPQFMYMDLENTPPPAPAPGRGRGAAGRGAAPANQVGQWGPTGNLQEIANYHGGTGTVLYRRALHPVIFTTNWAYVDHLILTPGAVDGLHKHPHVGEIYYVINGSGQVKVNGETAPVQTGDGIPVRPGEAHSFTNTGSQNLEMMIVGISTEKGVVDTEEVR